MSYLEPIEDSDMQPAERFGGASQEVDSSNEIEQSPIQTPQQPEVRIEGFVEKSRAEGDHAYGQILAQVQSSTPTDEAQADIAQDASEIHRGVDRETQLSHLIDIALTKGVEHAVATAEHLNDYYMLDQLHDTLVHDELHQKLIEKGLISEG
jgi:hypothetical protein